MMQLEDWLDDLCVRFVLNIPQEELESWERVCFQIEEANWFYEDFIQPSQSDPKLPHLHLKQFFYQIIQRCPGYEGFSQQKLEEAYNKFIKYKNRVPVRGAILLNEAMDQVVLVRAYKKNGTWSFPRGKINKGEPDLDCAIREAWEETGFDLRAAGLVKNAKKTKFVELVLRNQNMKLFIFRGVPLDAKFEPQTRKEIGKIQWFRLVDLPTEKRRNIPNDGTGTQLNANKFYVVSPFMHDLKKIIAAERKRDNRQSSKLAYPPANADYWPAQEESGAPTAIPHNGPLSPPVPSSLPELHVAAAHQPYDPTRQAADAENRAKSEKLLALLHRAPSAEMRNDPYTPLDQPPFISQPESPQQSSSYQHNSTDLMQSPPAFDTQTAHPTAPPSSALPRLTPHAMSLLEAFNRPPAPADQSRQQLPAAKQSLLAAFMTQPKTNPQPDTPKTANAGDSLLQLLHRKEPVEAVQSPPQVDVKALEQHPPHVPQPLALPQASGNTLLDLLQHKPAESPQKAAQPLSYAAAAGIKPAQARTPKRVPVELSASVETAQKPRTTEKPKTVAKATKSNTAKTRSGTTSATLDQPFDEPQFDAVPKAPTYDEVKREPVSGKKLFDPRHDQVKQIKGQVMREDRQRQPKSPRTARQKQNNTSRPSTPKETQKPFQPQVTQILRRPQTSEGEPPATLSEVLPLRPPPQQFPGTFSPDAPTQHDPQKEALLALLRPTAQPQTQSQPQLPQQSQPSPESSTDPDQTPRADPVISPPSVSQIVSPILDGEEKEPRSRVSSLASAPGNAGVPRFTIEKRQTAPGDKAFLMNLLKGYAGESTT